MVFGANEEAAFRRGWPIRLLNCRDIVDFVRRRVTLEVVALIIDQGRV